MKKVIFMLLTVGACLNASAQKGGGDTGSSDNPVEAQCKNVRIEQTVVEQSGIFPDGVTGSGDTKDVGMYWRELGHLRSEISYGGFVFRDTNTQSTLKVKSQQIKINNEGETQVCGPVGSYARLMMLQPGNFDGYRTRIFVNGIMTRDRILNARYSGMWLDLGMPGVRF